ncbi:MAG: hypothetical protein QM597_02735 [Aeromicrobium sp.]|uniref:hypothetical protein n=1 Tax=Aeromicrobium sp. TaxID=1871063 RepID=UPI0039E29741
MTWDAYRRRKIVVSEVLAIADADAGVTLADAVAAVPEAREAYPDDALLLLDIQIRWATELGTRLDVLVGDGADTPEIGVINAWCDAAAALPGARRLLDAGRHLPEMAKAIEKENEILARAAGVPAMSPTLLDRGQEIADSARDQAVLPEIAPAPAEVPNLFTRLRNALAA